MPKGNHKRRRRNNGLKKVKEDIKWLKQNIEFKHIDLSNDEIADDAGDVTCFNALILGGTDRDERVGEELTARRIMIRGFIHNDRGTPADGTIRIIVFREKQGFTVLPSVSSVLDGSGTLSTNRMRQMDDKENIVVYADHTITYDTLQHSLIPFKFMFKLSHQVHYTVQTAQVPQTNSTCMLIISNQATTANAPGVAFTGRYSFIDS